MRFDIGRMKHTFMRRYGVGFGAAFVGAMALTTGASGALMWDDHSDVCQDGTILAPGVWTAGTMGMPPDIDWFAFDVTPGRLYSVSVRSLAFPGFWSASMFRPGCGEAWRRFDIARYPDSPSVAFVAEEKGQYGLRLAWSDMYPGGPYEVMVEDGGPMTDDHPNDVGDGTWMAADGADVEGRFDYLVDVDCFRVELAAGMVYSLELRNGLECGEYFEAPIVGAAMERAHTDQTIARVSSYRGYMCSQYEFTTSAFAVDAEGGGVFDITVRLDGSSPGIGAYTLRVRPIGEIPADDHGGTCDTATHIEASVEAPWTTGVCYTDGDEDYFVFEGEAERVYRFEIEAGWWGGVAYEVYNPACSVQIGEGDARFDDAFVLGCEETGRYSVRVRGGGEGAINEYRVRVIDLGDDMDDHADDRAGATVMTADGAWSTGRIDTEMDEDLFRLEVESNVVYAMEVESLACRRVFARLEGDPSGDAATAIHNLSSECEPSYDNRPVVWYFVGEGHSGDRFVRVRSLRQDKEAAGEYRVRVFPVWRTEGDDHGDGCESGTTVSVGGAEVRGVLRSGGDQDWFRFNAEQGHVYRVWTAMWPDRLRQRVLAPGDGGECGEEFGSTEYIYAWEAGWHSVRLDSWTFGDGTPYVLMVADEGPAVDDHRDIIQQAVWVPTDGTELTGVINYSSDTDVFRVRLFAYNAYRVRIRPLEPCALFRARIGLEHLISSWPNPCEAPESTFVVQPYQAGAAELTVQSYDGVPGSYAVSVELLSCSADVNVDGLLNSADFFLFMEKFLNADNDADFDSDGIVDSRDLFEYLRMYFGGC